MDRNMTEQTSNDRRAGFISPWGTIKPLRDNICLVSMETTGEPILAK